MIHRHPSARSVTLCLRLFPQAQNDTVPWQTLNTNE
jgi:hypothetical protein